MYNKEHLKRAQQMEAMVIALRMGMKVVYCCPSEDEAIEMIVLLLEKYPDLKELPDVMTLTKENQD